MLALLYNKSLLRYAGVRLLARRFPGWTTGPGSFLRLAEVPEPKLPTPRWVRVRPLLSGICGSDLAVLSARSSIYLSAFTSFPFVPGHEVVGVVEETGGEVTRVRAGQRVVIEPALGCRVRGIREACRPCSGGHYANCERVTSGDIATGIQTGYCRDTGGGWGAKLVAHESQVYAVPDNVPNEAAVLAEPLSCALHGALMAPIEAGSRVLVVGCGSMGLLTIAALRAVAPPCTIVAMAKHGYQRELAGRLGADHFVPAGLEGYTGLVELAGGTVHRLPLGRPAVSGGFDVTYDCVGSASSLEDATRWTRSQGRVIMVGMPGVARVDLTPSWYQEVSLTGAYACSVECLDGRRLRSFELALELLSRPGLAGALGSLVRHRFPLREYRQAIATALRPGRHQAAKTVFDMTGDLGAKA